MSWERHFSKRILFVTLLLLCFPVCYSGAQDFPLLSGVTPFNLGSVTITPVAKFGYEKIGLSFNLPLANGNALDLGVKDANLGLGSVGVLASIGDRFAMFVNAEATLKKNLVVSTLQESSNAERISLGWTGSQFQQGQLEAGLLYRCKSDISLVGGLRRTRIMMKLTDPRNAFGPTDFSESSAASFDFFIFHLRLSEAESQRYFADFNTSIWMPFLGVRLTGLNYTASLIGSPVGWVQLGIPFRLQQRESDRFTAVIFDPSIFIGALSAREDRASQINYKFNKTGVFLEGYFDYDLLLGRGFGLNLWARGSWMHFRGAGSAGYTLDITDRDAVFLQVLGFTLLDLENLVSSNSTNSASAQGSFSIYTYSIGASASVSF